MNEDIIKGNWNKLKGSVQSHWGKLTGDKLDQINGERNKLVGEIQKQYGITRDEAEKQVDEWGKKSANG